MRRHYSIVATFAIRGAGSGLALLLTWAIVQALEGRAAAQILLVFNCSLIGAICFRWGADEAIVREVARAPNDDKQHLARELLGLAHLKVGAWTVSVLLLTLALMGTGATEGLLPGPGPVAAMVLATAAAALSACAGRVWQARGHTNLAAFVLTGLIPGGTLALLFISAATVGPLRADHVAMIYASAAGLAYLGLNWWPGAWRPHLRGALTRRRRSIAWRASTVQLGWITLSQQSLVWGSLLIVPIFFTAAEYVQYSLSVRLSAIVALVMMAVNFAMAAPLARASSAGDMATVRELHSRTIRLVCLGSGGMALGVLLLGAQIEKFFGITSMLLLGALLGSQVMFSIAASSALALAMLGEERKSLVAHAGVNGLGLLAFTALAATGPLNGAASSLLIANGALSIVLTRCVRSAVG